MERVARHAWLAKSCGVLHAEDRARIPRTLLRVRFAKLNQGLRSFHSLNPWLLLHPSGVPISPVDLHQQLLEHGEVNRLDQMFIESGPHRTITVCISPVTGQRHQL